MALTDNLVSYWKLDESSGNAADSVGSNTLTNNNSTAYATGKINNGADFENSSSQYLSIADGTQSGLDITGDLSISFWWKPESHTGFTWLVSKYLIAGNQRSYGVYYDTGNTLYFVFSNNGTATSGAGYSFTPSDGTWYHIVIAYNSSGVQTIYVNGSSIGTTSSLATSIFNSSADFWVGGGNNDPDVDGVIDEVGIWSRTLTEVEVGQLYNLTSGLQYPFTPEPSSLVAQIRGYWKLDESSGNAADSYGSSTLTNANSTPYVSGKINNGADFELSSSQYLYCADSVDLSITGDISMSAWIKPESAPGSGIEYAIIGKNLSSGNQLSYVFGYFNNGGTLRLQLFLDQTGNATTYETLSKNVDLGTGTFKYVAVTWTASTKVATFYVDGSSIGTHTGSVVSSIFNGTGNFNIGKNGGDGTAYFDGMIDEAGIWTRALTSTEITSLYNGGSGKSYPFPTIQNLTMAADVVSFVLTGYDVALTKAKTMIATVSNFILTGYDVILTWTGTHWTNQSKNTSTWSNQSKNDSTWSNLTKH